MTEFSNAIKNEFGHVAELVRITKVLSDESTRSTRALDVTIEEIENALIELESDNPAQGTSLPDEVATVAKLLASAAANLVTVASKGGKQDELIAAANVIKKQAHGMDRFTFRLVSSWKSCLRKCTSRRAPGNEWSA